MLRPDITRVCGVVVIALLWTGCEKNHYDIVMTPREDGLQREFSCFRKSSRIDTAPDPFPQEELQAIAKIYQGKVPDNLAQVHHFAGKFMDRMPQDVGGAGWYVTWTSPLGTSYGYVERFRGDIDLLSVWERRNKAADQLVDHLIGWLRTELGSEPYFERLHKLLDVEFRRDLKNLSLLSMNTLSRPEDQTKQRLEENSLVPSVEHNRRLEEFLTRAGIYLAERGYFKPQEIPSLQRMFHDDGLTGKKVQERAVRFLATKLGMPPDQPLPPKLHRLADLKTCDASMMKYAEATADYRQRLEKWEARKKTEPGATKPKPDEIFGDPLWTALLGQGGLFGGSDAVTVRLKTEERPYHTNGKWDAQSKSVSWSFSIAAHSEPNDEWPRYCSALWNVPDAKAQERCFGRVLLKDNDLAKYCVWYQRANSGKIASIRAWNAASE